MVISIDGADGVGKTTLAKQLSKHINFDYIKDPLDEIVRILGNKEKNIEATKKAKTHVFHTGKTDAQIANFLCRSLLSLKKKTTDRNLVIDRDMMSAAVYNLNDETEPLFDYFLKENIAGDICIFLYATQTCRIQRLIERAKRIGDEHNDLNNDRVLSLDSTRTIEYIKSRNINSIIVDTTNKNAQQVFEEVVDLLLKNPTFQQNNLKSQHQDDKQY